MSNIYIEDSIKSFYEDITEYRDTFSFIANKYNIAALSFLAESIIHELNNEEQMSKLFYQFFIDSHKEYINRLAFGIIYKTKLKLNLKEE